ncbi:MAG: thioredoxin [Nanoarchaeota archaeon]
MVEELTSENFSEKVEKEEKPVIIDLSADWCAPCKALTPAYKELSKEIKQAKFYEIDVDKEPELTKKFGVMSVPTVVILKKGKEVGRINGFSGKDSLKEKILSKVS